MSRLTTMSPEAIRAIFSPEADSDLLFLLTVYNPDNPEIVVARICDGFTKRISETANEVIYGVTSRSQDFIFLPMEISLPTEEEAQAPRCAIVMRDVTKYIIPIVRTIVGPPKVKMELSCAIISLLLVKATMVNRNPNIFFIMNILKCKDQFF